MKCKVSKTKTISFLLLAFSFWNVNKIEAKSALDAIEEAKNAADTMRSAVRSIADKYAAIDALVKLADDYVDTNTYLVAAKQDIVEARKNVELNKLNVEDAQKTVQEAEQAKAEWMVKAFDTDGKEDRLKKEVERAKKIVDDLNAQEVSLRKRYEAVAGTSSIQGISPDKIKKVLEETGYDENMLDEIATKLGVSPSNDVDIAKLWSDLGLDTIYDKITVADEYYSKVLTELDVIVDAKEQLKNSQKDLESAYLYLTEATKYYEEAKLDLQNAQNNLQTTELEMKYLKKDIKDQQSLLDPSKLSWKSMQTQIRHYSWKDKNGFSGRQTEVPFAFSMADKTNEYYIATSYIFSNNKSATEGAENSFSDLTLSYSKRRDLKDATLRYLISINTPIGKSQINSNAIMLDDLVPNSRFSYGFNVTPGISYTKMFGDRNSLTYTALYDIRGKYKYDTALPDAMVSPGNQLTNSLSWLYAGDKWQFMTTLDFILSDKTNENGLIYKEGKNLSWGLYLNKILSPKHDLMVYFSFHSSGASSYYTPVNFEIFPDGVNQRFYGIQWQNKISQKHTLRVMLNGMNTTGASYNPINFTTSYSRVRYGFSIGYDIAISNNSSISLEWEKYRLKERSPGTTYKGNNFYLLVNRSF